MAYLLKPTTHVGRDVRRAARERVDGALAELAIVDDEPARIEQHVHDVRKRCKEARGLARLVRPALGADFDRFNRLVRDAAGELSATRDAHAVLATLDRLLTAAGTPPALEPVRAGQAEIARAASAGLRPGDRRLERAAKLLRRARVAVQAWDLPQGFDPLAAGLDQTVRDGARALTRARRRPTDDRLHDLRKAVKQLWYQVRLLEPAAPSMLSPLAATLDDLSEALGEDHDLAVLVERLGAEPDRFGGDRPVAEVVRLARARQDELRTRSFRLASTVYAEPPSRFVDRISTYWRLCLDEGREPAPDRPPAPDRLPAASERRPASVELERKFLLSGPIELPTGTAIRQAYVAIDRAVEVRVRDAGSTGCTLTVKAGAGGARTEVEWPIDPALFERLWRNHGRRNLTKTRSLVPLGDRTAEVDVFHDGLSGLVVVEVEFDDEASMAAFTPPEWFGLEVTDDPRYRNAALADSGVVPSPPTTRETWRSDGRGEP